MQYSHENFHDSETNLEQNSFMVDDDNGGTATLERVRVAQEVIELTKEDGPKQWHVKNRAKVFMCKKAGGQYPCDCPGVNLFVEIKKSNDQSIIFSGEVATNIDRKFDFDIDVTISNQDTAPGSMYVHLEEQ
ncbi:MULTISPECIES: hypothetical protein [unclassified Paenibacillus]|uniref:hypothetical protein n=1 Tax=unclassified Paenibacillus TaxID=185978 RepID=UPI0008AEB68E|nr:MULTISPECIES: hypothetical protein [unclassified Paenibacillus]QLG39948.1 hypothetical protein HW560_18790 [Paenibacillus sp. E222]SEN91499.1 hypothetical protein SAMN05518670_3050 [Paenibacillus sp. OK076]